MGVYACVSQGGTATRLFLASLFPRVSFARVSISWLFGGGVQKGDLGSKMKPEPIEVKQFEAI